VNSGRNRFLGFKDSKTGATDCLILYTDDACDRNSGREITVPVLDLSVSVEEGSGLDILFAAWVEIQKYVEHLLGKKYANDNTFITIAQIDEDRKEIITV